MTYAQAIRDAIAEEMEADSKVVLIGEDIGIYGGAFGVTRGLWEKFGPSRILETPISETAFTGAAVGMAFMGYKPVVEMMFGDFASLAIDPIVNHGAKYHFMTAGAVKCPLVLRLPCGSGTGAAAQHSQSLESLFLNSPGLIVLAPSTPQDAKSMLKWAIQCEDPVIFIENKLLYRATGEVSDAPYNFGKAKIAKEGSDLTIYSYSRMVEESLKSAIMLDSAGISAEVVDLMSLRPLDEKTIIESAMKTSRALVVHEAPLFGGFGAQVSSLIAGSDAFYCLDAPIKRLGGLEMPIAYTPSLEASQIPTASSIYEAALEMME